MQVCEHPLPAEARASVHCTLVPKGPAACLLPTRISIRPIRIEPATVHALFLVPANLCLSIS